MNNKILTLIVVLLVGHSLFSQTTVDNVQVTISVICPNDDGTDTRTILYTSTYKSLLD